MERVQAASGIGCGLTQDFYDVALDDERFLMARANGSGDSAGRVVLVQNIFEELEGLVPN